MAKIKINHIAYKGSGEALTDVIGGRVDGFFAPISAGIGHIQSGKARALAVSTIKCSSALPNIPTIAESGTLDHAVAMAGFFFRDDVTPEAPGLVVKGLTAAQSVTVAARALAILEGLDSVAHEAAEPPLRALVEELGLSPNQVFGILRVAVTGQSVSPPLFESMAVIGRETVLVRVRRAVQTLEAAAAAAP